MDRVAKITKNEAEVTENFNKVVEVCKKIPQVNHQTSENKKQANHLELKADQLKEECMKLEVDAELWKKRVEFQERNVTEQIQILQDEKEQHEVIWQGIWKEMREFINEVNGHTFTGGRDEAQKILEMREADEAKRCLKMKNLKLEGEIYALDSYRKFQEKRLAEMENQIEIKQCKVGSSNNNQQD